jgi:N-acetyl sugar amidotransferase
MRYCTRCVMPDTKPGVTLDEKGVCSACRSVEKKKDIDWDARANELADLCDSVRGSNGNGYDCMVPVSGGKDSQYQVWMMKVVHKMNVLAVCVVPHLQTREGIANLNNIVKAYNVDLIKVALKPSVFKRIRTKAFFEKGEPNWADHCSVFAGAARVAYTYHIPLVVWGEDIAVEFGGSTSNKRVSSAENLIKNDLIKANTIEDFYDDIVWSNNTLFYKHPPIDELKSRKLKSIYLGYYHNWDGKKHYEIAKEHGFQARKLGPLSGNILDYDNMDEKLCEINIWFKFLKFGFWRPTDQCCYQIWNGRMSRKEAVALVNAKQYEFPKEYFKDFLEFHQIKETEFWETVEKFRNKEIWHKVNGEWRLKAGLI